MLCLILILIIIIIMQELVLSWLLRGFNNVCVSGDNLRCSGFVKGCLKYNLAPFFYVRYPSTGPHVQCVKV